MMLFIFCLYNLKDRLHRERVKLPVDWIYICNLVHTLHAIDDSIIFCVHSFLINHV